METQREGPEVRVMYSCHGCKYQESEKYVCQDDWGFDNYCTHPAFEDRKYIGDSGTQTPDFCPFKVDLKAENEKLREALETLVDKYICNKGTEDEFIACITPEGTPDYWENAKQALSNE